MKLRFYGFLVFSTLSAVAMPLAASAQSAMSSSASEAAGATTGLGTTHRFKTVAAATAHCPGDTIVWSSGKGLTYYPYHPEHSANGTAKSGFFACKMEADSAGFQPAAAPN